MSRDSEWNHSSSAKPPKTIDGVFVCLALFYGAFRRSQLLPRIIKVLISDMLSLEVKPEYEQRHPVATRLRSYYFLLEFKDISERSAVQRK